MIKQLRKLGNRGNAIVEFAICLPPLLFALFTVVGGGLWFDRYMSVLQLGRTGASMFSRGMNFSLDKNKDILIAAGNGLGITRNGGRGVIYLTRLVMAPPGTNNEDQLVIAERFIIGDENFHESTLGEPASWIWPNRNEPLPNGKVRSYQDEPSAVATAPASLATLPYNESMYVCEVYHDSQDLNFGRAFSVGPLRLSTAVYF